MFTEIFLTKVVTEWCVRSRNDRKIKEWQTINLNLMHPVLKGKFFKILFKYLEALIKEKNKLEESILIGETISKLSPSPGTLLLRED